MSESLPTNESEAKPANRLRGGLGALAVLTFAIVAGGAYAQRRAATAASDTPQAAAAAAEETKASQPKAGTKTSTEPAPKTETKPDADKPAEKDVEYPFRNRIPVPENIFEGGKGWLNASGDVRLRDLKGKIVVLDFWTYCCINCIHVLPDLEFIEKKYPNEVVVIGVHSAKFDNEKETENIRRAIQRYNIEHPVVNDAEMLIWRKFGVNAWPTLLVIDAEGNACFATSGEGKKEILDLVVSKLVEYHDATKTLDRTPVRFDLEREKMPPRPLKFPGKLLADAEGKRLFVADTNHNRIVVASLDGKLQAVIGSGAIGAKDGSYEEATFDHPHGMALLDEMLYVADTENHLLRVIDLRKKTVTTLAGTGEQDRERTSGGPLRETALNSPWDLAIHDGFLYVAMAGPHQLFRHKLGSDSINLFAGSGREDVLNGSLAESAFAQPSGFASDGKHLYVADSEGSSIRKVPFEGDGPVTTIAGTFNLPRGQSLFAFGDVDGVGDEARLQHPIGVAYHDGIVYVADSYNHKIRKIALGEEAGKVTTWLGDGKSGDTLDPVRLNEPHGVSVANGTLYIADTNNHRILAADLKTGATTAVVIDGLTPPKKLQAAPVEPPGKMVVQAALQKVAASEALTFDLTIELPEDYKLNPLGTVTGRLKAEGEQSLVAADQLELRHAATVENGRIRLKVPASGKPGQATFELSLSFTYCREGTGGVCKLASVRWKVPVEAAANATATTIPLEASVE